MRDNSQPGTLYRLFDAEDHLLYVGASMSAPARLEAHRRDKSWWPEVARATFEHYETRHLATVAEADAIESEHPRYNKAGPHICPDPDAVTKRLSRADVEQRHRERTMYRVEGLHCWNCGWEGGWVPKGKEPKDCPCPECKTKSLARPVPAHRIPPMFEVAA